LCSIAHSAAASTNAWLGGARMCGTSPQRAVRPRTTIPAPARSHRRPDCRLMHETGLKDYCQRNCPFMSESRAFVAPTVLTRGYAGERCHGQCSRAGGLRAYLARDVGDRAERTRLQAKRSTKRTRPSVRAARTLPESMLRRRLLRRFRLTALWLSARKSRDLRTRHRRAVHK
jgi:hypothetical protein